MQKFCITKPSHAHSAFPRRNISTSNKKSQINDNFLALRALLQLEREFIGELDPLIVQAIYWFKTTETSVLQSDTIRFSDKDHRLYNRSGGTIKYETPGNGFR